MWFLGPPDVDKLSAKRSVKGLIKALGYKDDSVREAAARELGYCCAVSPLAGPALDAARRARAVEPLIGALDDHEGSMRYAASHALGQIGDARAVEPLIRAFKDSSLITANAVELLGKSGDARATEPLIAALRSEDRHGYAAQVAALALGQIRDARAVEPLIAALTRGGKGWEDRTKAAARALGQIGDARAVEFLLRTLEGRGSTDLRMESGRAAEALGRIGDARAVEPLIRALAYEAEIRKDAARALVRMYHSGRLDETERALILAQRGRITQPYSTSEETELRGYDEVYLHRDSGIGVEFPL